MLIPLLLLVAAPATASASVPEPDVAHMGPKDIKAFNQTVPPSHPYHIRCRSDLEIGSLVKRTTVCKTNQQWVRADREGNDNARDIGDRMSSKAAQGGM